MSETHDPQPKEQPARSEQSPTPAPIADVQARTREAALAPEKHTFMETDAYIREHVLAPLHSGPLRETRTLIDSMTIALRDRTYSDAMITEWIERMNDITATMKRLMDEMQRKASAFCGPTGAFAMAEAAHRCHKFLGYGPSVFCHSLQQALRDKDRKLEENMREHLLKDFEQWGANKASEASADEKFEHFLGRYFLTPERMQHFFREARRGESTESFHTFRTRLEQRFERIITDVLKREDHPYRLTFDTNISEETETESVIPRGGILVEIASELIMNALKVMEGTQHGSTVSINLLLLRDGGVFLRVRDDGPGSPHEHAEDVFAGRSTTQRYHGSGMGLSLLKRTIETEYGGSIRAVNNAEDDDGPGMTLICTLPPPKEHVEIS